MHRNSPKLPAGRGKQAHCSLLCQWEHDTRQGETVWTQDEWDMGARSWCCQTTVWSIIDFKDIMCIFFIIKMSKKKNKLSCCLVSNNVQTLKNLSFILSNGVSHLVVCHFRGNARWYVGEWGSKSENVTKCNASKSLKHYLVCEHFCLSHVISRGWLLDSRDSNFHGPTLLYSIV